MTDVSELMATLMPRQHLTNSPSICGIEANHAKYTVKKIVEKVGTGINKRLPLDWKGSQTAHTTIEFPNQILKHVVVRYWFLFKVSTSINQLPSQKYGERDRGEEGVIEFKTEQSKHNNIANDNAT